MEQSKLSKKLLIKKGNKVFLLNSIDNFSGYISPLPDNVSIFTQPTSEMDVAHVFVANTSELSAYAQIALASIKENGRLWFAYQKKSAKSGSDISRDAGWDILNDVGYSGVSLISIDSTWSSMRFRKQ